MSGQPSPMVGGSDRVDLPDGRALTIRPVVTADLDALAAMYNSLSVADRRFRFFTGTAPTRRAAGALRRGEPPRRPLARGRDR